MIHSAHATSPRRNPEEGYHEDILQAGTFEFRMVHQNQLHFLRGRGTCLPLFPLQIHMHVLMLNKLLPSVVFYFEDLSRILSDFVRDWCCHACLSSLVYAKESLGFLCLFIHIFVGCDIVVAGSVL